MAARITYTAIITDEDLIIRQAYHGGVDGPIFSTERPADLGEAVSILRARGFEVAGDWKLKTGYAGLSLEAVLVQY